mgnify:CR=1 FL=1
MPKRDWEQDYRRGFYDGFREGYNCALEQLRDLMYQAINCIPNHYTIIADPKVIKEFVAKKEAK